MLYFFLKRGVITLLAILSLPAMAECKKAFPVDTILFQADIQYLNPSIKANPYILVRIQGQAKKFMLDTGVNHHTTWEAFNVPAGHRKQITHLSNSSAEVETAHVNIMDLTGRSSLQEMGLIKGGGAELAREGIAGLISPQALAGNHPFLIDFIEGCFLVASHLDIKRFSAYHMYPAQLKPNAQQTIAVPIEVGKKAGLIKINTGSYTTALPSQLIDHFPLAPQTSEQPENMVDQPEAKKPIYRRVHFILNRLPFTHVVVKEIDHTAPNKANSIGQIGMDVLKNFVLVADVQPPAFYLLKKKIGITRVK
jgi:hypothetical protein